MKCNLLLCLLITAFTAATVQAASDAPRELKVLAWNIWGRLNQAQKYDFQGKSARVRMIEILEDSEADIICMVETYGSAADIAKALGYYYYTPDAKANLSIFSRYKLTDFGGLEGLSTFSHIQANARLSDELSVKVHCIWLTSGGRHIVAIKDEKLSEKEFIDGDNNRADMISAFLQHPEVKKDIETSGKTPVIVAGDFNCVSHLDYPVHVAKENYGRQIEQSPTHHEMLSRGFIDTWRHVHPKVTRETLGRTWTTVGTDYIYKSNDGFVSQDPKTHPHPEYRGLFARIDHVYSKGEKLIPTASKVIKHYKEHTLRSFPEFPSDHAGVLTTFLIR